MRWPTGLVRVCAGRAELRNLIPCWVTEHGFGAVTERLLPQSNVSQRSSNMRSSQELYDIPIYTYLCYIVSYRLSGFFSGTSSSSVVCSSRLIIAVARSLDRNTDAPRRHSLLRVTRAVLGARHAKANTGFRHRHHRHHLVGLVASASRWLVRHCSGDTLLPTEANK